MINAVRHESFPLNVSFEGEVSAMRDFRLTVVQGGRVRLCRGLRDAEMIDAHNACVTFSGAETALLMPCEPAWVQAAVLLQDGEEVHSEVREINVVDVLAHGQEGRNGML